MLHLFTNLGVYTVCILVITFIFVLIYEIINGFHDTANATATIIYTRALHPYFAVFISGLCNFFGVIMGGLSVAYAIVHLLPIDFLLMKINSIHELIMIFSMLLSAILWNLCTWYFGLPSSSSHTLIGSIIGITFIHSLVNKKALVQSLNISQLIDIFISLIISPLIGFVLSVFVLLLVRIYCYFVKKKFNYINLTADERYKKDGISTPPFLIRVGLIISSAGVSFSHGANDGQKGIGLIMLALMSVAPAEFIINLNSSTYDINKTRSAVVDFYKYCIRNYDAIDFNIFSCSKKYMLMSNKNCVSFFPMSFSYFYVYPYVYFINNSDLFLLSEYFVNDSFVFEFICKNNFIVLKYDNVLLKNNEYDNLFQIMLVVNYVLFLLKNLEDYNNLNFDQRIQVRYFLVYISDVITELLKFKNLSILDRDFLINLRKDLLNTIEYAPIWIVVSVALSLSLGTMIGWKRVVITIGEKIGKKNITYLQGFLSQVISAISIGVASYVGKPVSTTHVLSSAIIGTMLVEGDGVRFKTVKNILMAWILTLPASMLLSSILYLFLLFVLVFFGLS
ncbi:MAG: metal phosphate:H(+) symporter PitA [Candidatus Westeberhardia cardiocondylae]|nr:metal phosphate:H(+) symporter PitA [Candidatus Westeberhardia cardiocondylae]